MFESVHYSDLLFPVLCITIHIILNFICIYNYTHYTILNYLYFGEHVQGLKNKSTAFFMMKLIKLIYRVKGLVVNPDMLRNKC